MSSNPLVRKIEHLSKTLSSKQLSTFLDIMDEMALLVEQAHALPAKQIKHTPVALGKQMNDSVH